MLATGVAEDRIRVELVQGKPKEELRRLAQQLGADLVVVGARPGETGPHSLGKTARFLVDHVPGAALVIR